MDAQKNLEIFMFIDALGWELVRAENFLSDDFPCRTKVEMQFGYSCAAVPTILTGERPARHGHLSFFYYDPKHSPFKFFKLLAPFARREKSLLNRGRVRHLISRITGKILGYSGYFQLYKVPFDRLGYFNYCEKEDIFAPGGLRPCENLRDLLEQSKLPFHISDWRKSEEENIAAAEKFIREGKGGFVFLYTAALDGLLHFHLDEPEIVRAKLAFYRDNIKKLLAAAKAHAGKVRFTVISDHGMTKLTHTVDIKSAVEKLGLVFGKDYAVCYDSTMARFYFPNPAARPAIEKVLRDFPGRIITENECRNYGIDFADHRYGDLIFLLNAGIQIAPSDMSSDPLPGMHGFDPADKDSQAVMLATEPPDFMPTTVADYFSLMKQAVGRLKAE
ncbi:MAG: alkaline phosphatase family protein [Victivallaceae bacterium]|nr:alkaline phosphatase family protein [Victivallaceae bacterium]